MTRRAFVSLGFVFSASAETRPGAPVPNFTPDDLLAFEKPYDVLVRKYFGCPAAMERDTVIRTLDCRPQQGVVDGVSWKRAREAARRLFQLRD